MVRRAVLVWAVLLAALIACSGSGPSASPAAAGLSGVAPDPDLEPALTLAVLPDTQKYTILKAPAVWDLFGVQTRWIAQEARAGRVDFMIHLGDIVENNDPAQWAYASRSIAELDGVVDYALALGNHDYGHLGKAQNRDTAFDAFFPPARLQGQAAFGGAYPGEPDLTHNSYYLVSGGGFDLLVLVLEYGPREQVVDWAHTILDRFPDRLAILVTHAYLYYDSTRYDWATKGKSQGSNPHVSGLASLPGGVEDGEELWRNLVSLHANVQMVLCGHTLGDGAGYQISRGVFGNRVHEIAMNYQMRKKGGNGYLRLIRFFRKSRKVSITAFSPATGRVLEDPQNSFWILLDPQ